MAKIGTKTYRTIATFPSSSSNKTYDVKEDVATGELSCDCRGWTMKKPGKPRTCKHVQAVENGQVIQIGGSPEAAPAPAPVDLEPVLMGSKGKETGGTLEDLFKSMDERGL